MLQDALPIYTDLSPEQPTKAYVAILDTFGRFMEPSEVQLWNAFAYTSVTVDGTDTDERLEQL